MTPNEKYFEKQHKTLFKKVRSSIRKIKLKGSFKQNRIDKAALIADVSKANGDLMHLLATPKSYKDVSDYFDTINVYLQCEMACYEYDVPLRYKIGNMESLMEYIRLSHNKFDRIEELKTKVGL